MADSLRVGIDVGGTKMLVLAGARVWRFPTGPDTGPAEIEAHWATVERELGGGVAAGLAVPGLVDRRGIVRDCDVLPKLVGWNPRQSLPAEAVMNDGEAALAAIAAGEPADAVVVAIGCGTGLVAAAQVAGRSLRDLRPYAGELGLAPYGGRGTFDDHASGAALLRHTGLTPEQLHARIEQNEANCVEAVRRAGEAFGAALATVVHLLHPDKIGLYGGTLRYPGYLAAALEALDRRAHALLRSQCRVAPVPAPELVVADGARRRVTP